MKDIMAAIITLLADMRGGPSGGVDAVEALRIVVKRADSRVVAHVVTVLASIANLCDTTPTSDTQGEGKGSGGSGTGGRF